jgi:hypothetical protein
VVSYPNDLWDVRVEWRHIGKDFDSALGFVSRPGVNKLFVGAEYDPRPKNFLNVRQMFNEFRLWHYTRTDTGQVESWRMFIAPVNWTFDSGDRVEFNWSRQFEQLFEPFEISDGVILPTGDYGFNRYRLELWTSSKRKWQFEGTGGSATSTRVALMKSSSESFTKSLRISRSASKPSRPSPA